MVDEPEPEHEGEHHSDSDRRHAHPRELEEHGDLARTLPAQGREVEDSGQHRAAQDEERPEHMEEQQPVVGVHRQ